MMGRRTESWRLVVSGVVAPESRAKSERGIPTNERAPQILTRFSQGT